MNTRVFMKILCILILIFIHPAATASRFRICEIKYREMNLDRKIQKLNTIRQLTNEPLLKCHQIGVEHYEDRRPRLDRPIYACCSD